MLQLLLTAIADLPSEYLARSLDTTLNNSRRTRKGQRRRRVVHYEYEAGNAARNRATGDATSAGYVSPSDGASAGMDSDAVGAARTKVRRLCQHSVPVANAFLVSLWLPMAFERPMRDCATLANLRRRMRLHCSLTCRAGRDDGAGADC